MIGKQFIDLFFRVETKEAQKDIDNVGDGLDNIGKKGRIASGGLKLIGNGFKFIGGAIKAAGIGLLVGLLAQLTGVFQSNQKVADTFGRIIRNFNRFIFRSYKFYRKFNRCNRWVCFFYSRFSR